MTSSAEMMARRLFWLPTLDRACCCCSLDTFCKLIGFLSSIGGLILIVAFSTEFSKRNYHDDLTVGIAVFFFIKDGIVGFVLSIVFTVGLYLKRHEQLMPFVVYLHVQCIVCIHASILIGIQLPFLSLLGTIPALCLNFYILACVNSQREKLAGLTSSLAGMEPLA